MTEDRKVIVLDGGEAADRQSLHRYLRESLELPGNYGENLDALYDALTGICAVTVIRIERQELFQARLGRYGKRLLQVLRDAGEENRCLTVEFR